MSDDIHDVVARALAEDVGSGDVTADLVPEDARITATVITREAMTLAGRPWFDEVLQQVDAAIGIDWEFEDGDFVAAGELGPDGRTHGAEFPAAAVGGCDRDRPLRRRRRRHQLPHPRYEKDDPGAAPRPEVRGPVRRRHESPRRAL